MDGFRSTCGEFSKPAPLLGHTRAARSRKTKILQNLVLWRFEITMNYEQDVDDVSRRNTNILAFLFRTRIA